MRVVINNRMRPYGRAHSDGMIEINPKKGDVVNTMIHEELHIKDWDMPHEEVYKESARIEANMPLEMQAYKLLELATAPQVAPKPLSIKHTTASKVVKTNIK